MFALRGAAEGVFPESSTASSASLTIQDATAPEFEEIYICESVADEKGEGVGSLVALEGVNRGAKLKIL